MTLDGPHAATNDTLTVATRAASRPERLLVPLRTTRRAAFAGVLAAIVLGPAYWGTSPWIGPGVAVSVFVAWHGVFAAYQAPWLPGFIAFGACVQWVLAPWAIYELQRTYGGASMAVPPGQYFAFAVPSTLALVAGLYLPLWRRRGAGDVQNMFAHAPLPAGFVRLCEMMLWGGIALRVVALPFAPAPLRYVTYLFSMFALVGVISRMLLNMPGWRWRALVLLAVSAVGNAADLQFLEVILVTTCLGACYYFRFRPPPRTLAILGVPAAVVFLALSAFKVRDRENVRQLDLSGRDRAATAGLSVLTLARQPSLLLTPEILGASMNRLNEGWVTSRVLAWVPLGEPYARGETITTAIRAALLPRVLDPGKYVAGGAAIVPRFTGLTLINSTSVGLSVPGEMYANFGLDGAWIGTFVYGFLLGMVYLHFLKRARWSPLWLAWIPFVYFGALSVEPALGEVLNHLTKTLLLVWAVSSVVPQWRRMRRPRRAAGPMRRERGAPDPVEIFA